MKLIVQIPCFNEEATVGQVIDAIPRAIAGVTSVEVLVIDDGSSDRTAAVARAHGAEHIVRVPGNRGLAAAFQTGLDACVALGADLIVNTDGDHQYPGDQIPALIAPLLAGTADLVIGDRRPRLEGRYSRAKRLLHRIGSWAVAQAAGVDVPDPVSGFRALTREAARRLNIVTQFSYTTEMVIQAARKRLRIAHVVVRTNPPTRPSRLFRSVFGFVSRSAGTIIQTYALYRPLKTFILLGAIPLLVGLVPILRFLALSLMGQGAGRVQSLTLGIGLVVCGVMICTFGVLADVLARQRILIERLLDRVARLEDAVARPGPQAARTEPQPPPTVLPDPGARPDPG